MSGATWKEVLACRLAEATAAHRASPSGRPAEGDSSSAAIPRGNRSCDSAESSEYDSQEPEWGVGGLDFKVAFDMAKSEDAEAAAEATACLAWLGAAPSDPIEAAPEMPALTLVPATLGAAFEKLLAERLRLAPGDRDLVVMHHECCLEWDDDRGPPDPDAKVCVIDSTPSAKQGRIKRKSNSLMVVGGQLGEATAMARTVGVTAAIGVDLVLEGKLDEWARARKRHLKGGEKCKSGDGKGGATSDDFVATPAMREIYEPALQRLALEGIAFREHEDVP